MSTVRELVAFVDRLEDVSNGVTEDFLRQHGFSREVQDAAVALCLIRRRVVHLGPRGQYEVRKVYRAGGPRNLICSGTGARP